MRWQMEYSSKSSLAFDPMNLYDHYRATQKKQTTLNMMIFNQIFLINMYQRRIRRQKTQTGESHILWNLLVYIIWHLKRKIFLWFNSIDYVHLLTHPTCLDVAHLQNFAVVSRIWNTRMGWQACSDNYSGHRPTKSTVNLMKVTYSCCGDLR